MDEGPYRMAIVGTPGLIRYLDSAISAVLISDRDEHRGSPALSYLSVEEENLAGQG